MPSIKCLVQAKYMEDTQTTQYTSPAGSSRTVIDNMTVSNDSMYSVVFAINIVGAGGSASSANKIVPDTTISPGTRIEFLLQGQYLNANDFISTFADSNNSIVLRINGRVLT
jgi:hypothetical protein